jgi:hypothetical protein
MGVLGSLMIAFGAHAFVGALIGEFSFAWDTLATAVCTQPQSLVGINGGVVGTIGGIVLAIAGFAVRSRA